MSEYDIEPVDNPPDFSYDKGDEQEQEYVLGFLILLKQFYDKYKYKSVDYIIDNIDTDAITLQTDIIAKTNELDTFFDNKRDEILLAAGILAANISKTNITSKEIKNLKLEQEFTAKSIIQGVSNQIKAKAARSKYRATENIFSIDSNIRRVTNRLTNMSSVGFRDNLSLAERKAKVFLYGDPLSDWLTQGDGKVCKYCLAVQDASPMQLSRMPLGPLHPNCGERCKIMNHKDMDLELTRRAQDLTRYDLGMSFPSGDDFSI